MKARLDFAVGSAGLMRAALSQGLHYNDRRTAFGARLSQLPIQAPVLADVVAEIEELVMAPEDTARYLVTRLALAVQAALLVRHAPTVVADAFLASRLGSGWDRAMEPCAGSTSRRSSTTPGSADPRSGAGPAGANERTAGRGNRARPPDRGTPSNSRRSSAGRGRASRAGRRRRPARWRRRRRPRPAACWRAPSRREPRRCRRARRGFPWCRAGPRR
ncbi:hypothetical protein K1T34_01860 [Amycolatopsis sp. DSM 110486]|nr:hypothetical protein K1T34_01860 [Amycolatopsis sp. DSM 110486]